MNCRRFQQELEEYVEGTMTSRKRGAAERHLAGCTRCREILRRRQQLAATLPASLQQAASSLQLDPRVEQHVLREWQKRSSQTAAAREGGFGWLSSGQAWPWVAAAAALVAGILLMGRFLQVNGYVGGTASLPNAKPQAYVTIQASYRVRAHTFRWEETQVIDCMTFRTNVLEETLRIAKDKKSR